jgi:hypothetical protein
MKWITLLMLLVTALMAFGGSFSCHYHDDNTVIVVTRP